MIWRVTKPGAVYRAKRLWHRYFAWYPVRVPSKGRMSKQHKVWLQFVSRRGESYECYEGCFWVWSYCLIGDEYPRYKNKQKNIFHITQNVNSIKQMNS